MPEKLDFSGGLNTYPIERLAPNELTSLANCYWHRGLRSFKAPRAIFADADGGHVRGAVQLKDSVDYPVSLIAAYNAGTVTFYFLNSETETPEVLEIGTITGVSADATLEMVETNNGVIIVPSDASNWPYLATIEVDQTAFADSATTFELLETADIRQRSGLDLRMGITKITLADLFQLASNAAVPDDVITDDYRSGTDVVVASTTSARIWISSALTFNEIDVDYTFADAIVGDQPTLAIEAFLVAADGTYQSIDSITETIVTEQDGTWSFKWDWDTDYALYNAGVLPVGSGGTQGGPVGRGGFRALITVEVVPNSDTVPDLTIRGVNVRHTQYLRQVLHNNMPHLVELHNNRVFLAEGNFTQLSPYNRISGWRQNDQEYYNEGGSKVTALRSHGNNLAVFKERAIYYLTGNSYENWGKDKIEDNYGTLSHRSVQSLRDVLVFAETAGGICILAGENVRKVSNHLPEGFLGPRAAANGTVPNREAVSAVYSPQSESVDYWMASAAEGVANRRLWRMDPDTLRVDQQTGEFGASFFPMDLDSAPLLWEFDSRLFAALDTTDGDDIGYSIVEINAGTGPNGALEAGVVLANQGFAMNSFTKRFSIVGSDSNWTVTNRGNSITFPQVGAESAKHQSTINDRVRPEAPTITISTPDEAVLTGIGWEQVNRSF